MDSSIFASSMLIFGADFFRTRLDLVRKIGADFWSVSSALIVITVLGISHGTPPGESLYKDRQSNRRVSVSRFDHVIRGGP